MGVIVTEEILRRAESIWWEKHYDFREIELGLEKFTGLPRERGWLKKVRNACYLTTKELARRLQLTAQAYQRLERAEADGGISLKSLEACANALDCELIYAIRPKDRTRLSHKIARTLLNSLKHLYPYRNPSEDVVRWLVLMMHNRMYDAEFRRRQGWCRNNTSAAKADMQMREARRWLRRSAPPVTNRCPR